MKADQQNEFGANHALRRFVAIRRNNRREQLTFAKFSVRLRIVAIVLLSASIAGCGSGSSGGPPQFVIESGNWTISLSSPASLGPFAGGALFQSGNTISGILHITGLPCFDPIADALIVRGTVASDGASPLTLTTSSVRGQTLSVTATWNREPSPAEGPLTSPPNPVWDLLGTWTLSGGACAGTGEGEFRPTDFSGRWVGPLSGPTWYSQLTADLSQTGPDAQGFSQLSGTITIKRVPLLYQWDDYQHQLCWKHGSDNRRHELRRIGRLGSNHLSAYGRGSY